MDNPSGDWLDLSHPIYPEMPHPRFFPDTSLEPRTALARGDPLNTSLLTIGSHVGTHVDAPIHFLPGGDTLERLPLDRFMGEAVVLDLRSRQPGVISASALESGQPEVRPGDIVLLCAGWGEKFATAEYDDYPYLGEDAAHWLAERQVRFLGVDVLSPDMPPIYRPPDFAFPVHHILLSQQVLIAENLTNLTPLAGRRAFVIAQPLKLRGGDGSPSRIIALPRDASR